MYNKKEFFVALFVGIAGGVAIGYGKAREKFLEALLIATTDTDESIEKEEEES